MGLREINMASIQDDNGVEKRTGGGWDIDLPSGGSFFMSKELFQNLRDLKAANHPNFDVLMAQPATKFAYEAVIEWKADQKEGRSTASLAPVAQSPSPRIPLGAVKPVGLKPLTHQPQAATVHDYSPSSYTYASTTTTTLEIKPPSNCTIRDLTFSASAADARLVTVTLNNVPIFSAGGGSGDGILLSELTSQNTRGAFLAGHEIGPDSKGLKITLALPSTATVRAMCEHDTTLVGCTR